MRFSMARGEERPRAGSPTGLLGAASRILTGRSGAWLFTIAVAAAAVAVFLLYVVRAPAYDPADELPWPLFAIGFGLAEIAVVHLMVRSQAITVSLSEIPLVVGFYLLAPAYLVVAQFIGAGVVLVVYRRQPPLKLAFNLAIFVLGSSLAILVFQRIAGLGPTNVLVWWIASFLGAATAIAVSALAISVVISLRQRRLELGLLRRGLGFGVVTAMVNTSFALVVVIFLRTSPNELWLLVAPGAVGLLGYRAFSAQREREAHLEFLHECMQILQGPLLDEATLVRLLRRTQDMFRAGTVEAILARSPDDRTAMRVVIGSNGHSQVEIVGPDVAAGRRAMLGADGGGRLVEPEGQAARTWRRRARAGAPDAVIVPLRGADDVDGTLMLTGHLDDLEPFGTDDLQVLGTLGSRLGLVAENSGLIERLAASLADVSQLAAIVQSSEDAIVAVDLSGKIASWNPSAELFFGHRSEAVVGRLASEVLTEAERAPLRDTFTAAVQGEVVRDVRMGWVRADGVEIPVSITMSPIRGAHGEVIGASAILRDQSDGARAEAVVAASAELLRTVIDGSPLGMGVADAGHRWIQANRALCALLGQTEEETIGRSALDMIHPDDQDSIPRLEGRVFAGEPVARSVERRYIDSAGRVVVAEVTARLIRDPSSDEPVALYTVEDVTERRRAEEEARSAEERFRRAALAISAVQEPTKVIRAVLESARDTLQAEYAAVATFSDDGTEITQIEVDGLDPDEMLQRLGRWPTGTGVIGQAPRIGRPVRLRDLQSDPAFVGFPRDHPSMTSFLGVPILHHGVGRMTLYLANKMDGDEFSESDETIALALATHAAVCLDNARVNARARELVNDLDRANLELVQANEAKSRFLASVAHELRTPLHAILIAGELVHDPPAGPLTGDEVRALGVTIESSGRHMVSLIDDLVDLSRIEAGRLDLRPTQVMLGVVFAEVASSLARTAETSGIVLDLPDGPGPALFADPGRLRQILTNLVANALKFTERGGRVWVEVGSTRGATRVTVHDTGMGIAPEDIDRAFLPFEQVSRTSTPGAGLGLAIARSLAELHGGELSATSEPGVGSAFTLTLPHLPKSGPRKPSSAAIPVPVLDAGGGRAILVVEDDDTAMGLATDVLRMADYDVWQARGLGEAIALLDVATPALVLLDVRLGDGSGLELVERLRSDGTHADLPILVLSADAMPDDAKRAREAGCNDFLAKPVGPRVLLSRIHDLIGDAPEGEGA